MSRVLPAMSLAALFTVGCTNTVVRPVTRPNVMPVVDPALYACVERTASNLGFNRQTRAGAASGALLATTDTNRVTGVYDGMRVRILSDTGRVATWITASPYTGVANRGLKREAAMPSRRAIEAAATVERRCRSAQDTVARGARASA